MYIIWNHNLGTLAKAVKKQKQDSHKSENPAEFIYFFDQCFNNPQESNFTNSSYPPIGFSSITI